MTLNIGDLVFVTSRNAATDSHTLQGKIGRIVKLKNEDIGVAFNDPIGGHDLDGACLKPYGFYVRAQYLQKMEPLANELKKQWDREWEPKLKKKTAIKDTVILLE
jgi:hypothetical protein